MSRKQQSRPKDRDPHLAAASAAALFNLSIPLLSGIASSGHLPTDTEGVGKIVASVTNLSLSAELCLKALWISAGKDPPEHHDLSGLFKNLPSDVKAACVTRYRTYPPAPKGQLTAIVVDSFDVTKPPSPDERAPTEVETDRSLSAVLKRSKDAFTTWRYLYERDQGAHIKRSEYEFYQLQCACRAFFDVLQERHTPGFLGEIEAHPAN